MTSPIFRPSRPSCWTDKCATSFVAMGWMKTGVRGMTSYGVMILAPLSLATSLGGDRDHEGRLSRFTVRPDARQYHLGVTTV